MREERLCGLQVGCSEQQHGGGVFCFEAANWLRVAFIIMAIFILCKERLDCTLAALKQLEYFEGSCLECF